MRYGAKNHLKDTSKRNLWFNKCSQIGRKTLSVIGKVPAANYIDVSTKTAKGVLVTGRYIYFCMQQIKNKEFFIHIDLMMQDCNKIVMSLSNTYKQLNFERNKIKVPLKLKEDVWTVINLDVHGICGTLKAMPKVNIHNQRPATEITAIRICANINIKNVYSSSNDYAPDKLPKEMGFLHVSFQEWSKMYSYVVIPEKALINDSGVTDEENSPQKIAISKTELLPIEPMEPIEQLKLKENSSLLNNQSQAMPDKSAKQEVDVYDIKSKLYGTRSRAFDRGPNNVPLSNLQHIIGYTGKACPDVRFVYCRNETYLASAAGSVVILSSVGLIAI